MKFNGRLNTNYIEISRSNDLDSLNMLQQKINKMNIFDQDDDRKENITVFSNPSIRKSEIWKLAAPLTKEQLICIFVAAVKLFPEIKTLIERESQSSPSARRLMIRNIDYNTTDDDFYALFSSFGKLDDAVIIREKSGKSKGFGFVTFSNLETIRNCLVSNLILDGRQLFVKIAADPFSEFVANGNPIDGKFTKRKIFVRNLPVSVNSKKLELWFTKFGVIEECTVARTSNGESKGFGFITFKNPESAVLAAAKPQQSFDNYIVFISVAKSNIKSKKKKKTVSKTNSPCFVRSFSLIDSIMSFNETLHDFSELDSTSTDDHTFFNKINKYQTRTLDDSAV